VTAQRGTTAREMKRRGTNARGTETEKEKEQLGGSVKEKEHEK